ncbi:MAG: hypothetical protein ACRC8T_05785 [Acidaminococcaceae bacterium]
MNEVLSLIEEYQFIFDECESEQATKNYETCLSCGADGIAISANWLFKQLKRPERQKDILPVLLQKGLIATIDILSATTTYGICNYDLSLSAAEKIIINHDNYYVACDVLKELLGRYTAFRNHLIANGYKNI